MRFFGLSATEFTLLFTAGSLALVVFYLFSTRRRTLVLAADPIWRRVSGRRHTPFRKLLSLLLQIAIVFIFALALADPRALGPESAKPQALALIVDDSASMAARESDGRRIERARRLVRAIAARAGPGDRLALFAMDESCRPLSRFGPAQKALAGLERLEPAAASENVRACVDFTSAALDAVCPADFFRRRIVIISDRFHDLGPQAKGSAPELVQVALGDVSGNLELAAFDVRPRSFGARGNEVFVEVKNRGPQAARARLRIHTPRVVLGDETIAIAAGASFSRVYILKPLPGRRLMASLTAVGSDRPADAFALDDRAYALLPRRERRKILLVTAGNLFLEKALALDPTIELDTVAPAAFRPQSLAAHDAAFFDGLCPASPVPAAYFDIPAGAAADGCPFSLRGQVDFPKLLPLAGDHQLTAGISLIDLQIEHARRLVPESGDLEILRDQVGPLMIARELKTGDRTHKLLGAGFDLATSDLPLRVAFPQLVHNCLDWFLGPAGSELRPDLGVGEPILFDRRPVLSDPDGKPVAPRPAPGRQWLALPRRPGFYSLAGNTESKLLPVDFRLAGESDLAGDRRPGPGRVRYRRGEPPQALLAGLGNGVPAGPARQWPALLLAAAWLLLFDWLFYCLRMLY